MDSSATFSSAALTDVASNVNALFSLPSIGLPSSVTNSLQGGWKIIFGVLSSLGLARGIPIYASQQQEIGQNNIGDQIMLRASELGTQVVTDNIAPLPRVWRIEGYISCPINVRLNSSADYILLSSNSTLVVQAIKNYFRFLRTLRAPFSFITREGETIDVLMQNYTFTDTPESEWATHINIELKEYIALGVGKDAYSISNMPSLGSIFGKSAQYVTAGTKVIGSALKMFV